MIKYVAFALAIVVALPACAGDWDWDMRSGSPTASRGRVAYYHRRHHKPRVMAYERRSVERAERQDDDGGKCVDKVRGLGTQWIGTKGALRYRIKRPGELPGNAWITGRDTQYAFGEPCH